MKVPSRTPRKTKLEPGRKPKPAGGPRSINSRNKGAQGEREFAATLKEYGHDARRGQQFSGGTDSPDVVCTSLPDVHFEVKRTQAGNPYKWLAQAIRDAGVKMPIVAHRRNNEDWICVVKLQDLLELLMYRSLT